MRSLFLAAVVLANVVIYSWLRPAGLAFAPLMFAESQKPTTSGAIQGIVQAGNVPIPGVTVTATNTGSGEKVSTSTDTNGQYHIAVPATGSYTVETSMAAFSTATKETARQ